MSQQTYMLVKTGKKTTKHNFKTFGELSEYATTNRDGKGSVKLFTMYRGDTYHVVTVSNVRDLKSYCTKVKCYERGVSL